MSPTFYIITFSDPGRGHGKGQGHWSDTRKGRGHDHTKSQKNPEIVPGHGESDQDREIEKGNLLQVIFLSLRHVRYLGGTNCKKYFALTDSGIPYIILRYVS
jgi:hypothetical protein